MYLFFSNKRELAAEVVGARGAAGFLQTVLDQSLNTYDPEDLLKAIGNSYLGNLEERLPIVRFSIAEALSDKKLAKRYYDNLLQPLFDNLVRAMSTLQGKDILQKRDPFILSHLFDSMLFGYMYAQELNVRQGKDRNEQGGPDRRGGRRIPSRRAQKRSNCQTVIAAPPHGPLSGPMPVRA